MFVALYRKAFKPALPNMPAAPIMLVIASHVTGQKPLHELAQRLMMRRFNHEVKVVRHQGEGKELNWVSCLRQSEDGKKGLVVLSFVKYGSATVPSIDHMINKSSLLPARDSWHEQALSQRRAGSQCEKAAYPLQLRQFIRTTARQSRVVQCKTVVVFLALFTFHPF